MQSSINGRCNCSLNQEHCSFSINILYLLSRRPIDPTCPNYSQKQVKTNIWSPHGRDDCSTHLDSLFSPFVVSYGIQTSILFDSEPKIVSRHCTTTRLLLKGENPSHSPKNQKRQFEWYSTTLVSPSCQYVTEQKRSWDVYPQFLTYAYSTQTKWGRSTSPLNIILKRKQLMAANLDKNARKPT